MANTMAIKYQQNGIGNEYGADHQLTNNWNPDKDYGNEYVNVYFRMETKGYEYPSFSFTEEDRKDFDLELEAVFTSLGWKCEEGAYGGSCATWYKEKQHLYLHPQNFSGEVLKNEVKQIAEALEKHNTFYLRWVDLYETVYDMTDQEYEEILSAKDEDIKNLYWKIVRPQEQANIIMLLMLLEVLRINLDCQELEIVTEEIMEPDRQ